MNDHEAIRALLAEYCQSCDDGRWDRFGELFTEDAQFKVMGEVYTGRAAIREWMSVVQGPDARGKHIISAPLIHRHPTHAAAHCTTDFIFVGRGPDGLGITSTGRYVDELRIEHDGEWRIAVRELVFLHDIPN